MKRYQCLLDRRRYRIDVTDYPRSKMQELKDALEAAGGEVSTKAARASDSGFMLVSFDSEVLGGFSDVHARRLIRLVFHSVRGES